MTLSFRRPFLPHFARCLAIACVAALASVALPARAQPLIDTTTAWDGSFTMGSLCPDGAFGQTFTLAEPTTVQSFSVFMKTTPPYEYPDPSLCVMYPELCPQPWEPVTVRAQVLAWDPALSQPVGPILYESATTQTTSDTLTEFVFETGELALPPGMYVAILNSAGLDNSADARGDIGVPLWYVGDPYDGGYWLDVYPDGDWVFSQCTNAVDPTQYPTPWYTQGVAVDLAFKLYATSEPACPPLDDASGNGIPDVVDAQCPCTRRPLRNHYLACVLDAMQELVQDGCATPAELLAIKRAASQRACQ